MTRACVTLANLACRPAAWPQQFTISTVAGNFAVGTTLCPAWRRRSAYRGPLRQILPATVLRGGPAARKPITSIQLADTDGNDSTMADPAWTPLITTPAFPEYPSAHSCVSGAATQVLSQTFGEETSFNVVSDAMLGVTRTFHSFSAALEEIENARVFGGIHFRTACVDGTALGISVADYVMAHALLPTGGGDR
jgi:hypothetical protein